MGDFSLKMEEENLWAVVNISFGQGKVVNSKEENISYHLLFFKKV